MINVISLKWGTKYNADYVNKLHASIVRNTTLPIRFHCFTEDCSDLRYGIIPHNLPFADRYDGWWNKLYLFSNHFPIQGKLVFFDLDTLITGNIDDILNPPTDEFVVLRDFFAEKAKGVSVTDIGSGLMAWNTKRDQSYSIIWEEFAKNPKKVMNELHPHGDQRWIQKFIPNRKYWQDVLPGQVVSFKTHCAKGLPDGARVVCYHGKPSIPESIKTQSRGWGTTRIPPSKWVGDYWRE